MNRVLFIDIRNSIRSPMAEAWFNHLAGNCGGAASCGTMPGAQVRIRAQLQVLGEAGLVACGNVLPSGLTRQA